MAKGDIVLFQGRPAEIVSEGETIEVIEPSREKLTPEVVRRFGKLGVTIEEVLAVQQLGDVDHVLAR